MVPVEAYFVLSALLFFIGVFGFVTRRNLIAMLISVELVLNAVDINFAAFKFEGTCAVRMSSHERLFGIARVLRVQRIVRFSPFVINDSYINELPKK